MTTGLENFYNFVQTVRPDDKNILSTEQVVHPFILLFCELLVLFILEDLNIETGESVSNLIVQKMGFSLEQGINKSENHGMDAEGFVGVEMSKAEALVSLNQKFALAHQIVTSPVTFVQTDDLPCFRFFTVCDSNEQLSEEILSIERAGCFEFDIDEIAV